MWELREVEEIIDFLELTNSNDTNNDDSRDTEEEGGGGGGRGAGLYKRSKSSPLVSGVLFIWLAFIYKVVKINILCTPRLYL